MNHQNQESFYSEQALVKLTRALESVNRWLVMALIVVLCVELLLAILMATRCHQIDGITLSGHRFQTYSLSCPSLNSGLSPIYRRYVDWAKSLASMKD